MVVVMMVAVVVFVMVADDHARIIFVFFLGGCMASGICLFLVYLVGSAR